MSLADAWAGSDAGKSEIKINQPQADKPSEAQKYGFA